jgi:rRNA processing protein Gar1
MSDTHVVLGEVLKIVREYAVVKASSLPSLMEHVYDLEGSHVGYVSDVFGPV